MNLPGSSILNLLYPPNLPVNQAHLNPVRVKGGFRQNILDDPLSQLSRSLILFQHN